MKITDVLKRTPLYGIFRKIFRRPYADRKSSLVYIHIGKCGGASVAAAIRDSDLLAKKFRKIYKVHIKKPPLLKRARYVVVVRNPLKRALSAFNWRYKLVIEDEDPEQINRFAGESEVLRRYGSLNALAEALYDGDQLNDTVAREFRTIHHLHEDISFYLTDLLAVVKPEQIHFVLATETLDQDVFSLTGTKQVARTHENSGTKPKAQTTLSDTAKDNLRRFLAKDYAAVETLLRYRPSTAASHEVLLA